VIKRKRKSSSKLKYENNQLPPEFHLSSSQDLELSVELEGENKEIMANSKQIEEISSKVVEGLKNHFQSRPSTAKTPVPILTEKNLKPKSAKLSKPKLRKTSKTKSMHILLENRPLKRNKIDARSNISNSNHKALKLDKSNNFKSEGVHKTKISLQTKKIK